MHLRRDHALPLPSQINPHQVLRKHQGVRCYFCCTQEEHVFVFTISKIGLQQLRHLFAALSGQFFNQVIVRAAASL